MQLSSFFNSIDSDRKYKAEDWAQYFASFIGNGVFAQPSTSLIVQANTDMTITVSAGKAWINGYFFYNTANEVLTLSTADGVLKRIDRVIIRWSLTTRDIILQIKRGTPASNPAPPALQRDYDVYELALADIAISAGALSLTATNITDLRWNTSLCGEVAGVVTQIDATFITAQFDSFFAEYKVKITGEYGAYVQQITDQYNNYVALFQAQYDKYVALVTDKYSAFVEQVTELTDNSTSAYADLLAWFDNFKSQSTEMFNTWFTTNTTQFANAFNTWFDSIKGMLEGDIATEFAEDILELQQNLAALNTNINAALESGLQEVKDEITQVNGDLDGRLTTVENYIKDNLTFSTPAYLGYAYSGTAYLSNT